MHIFGLKRLKLRTKIALTYSIFVLVVAIALLVFLNMAVQMNMKRSPLLYNIAPGSGTLSLKINTNINAQGDSTPSGGNQDGIMVNKSSVDVVQLNSVLTYDIFNRIGYYSVLAILLISVFAFLISFYLSKWVMKPLKKAAQITQQLTPDNLGIRLDIPDTNDEFSQLVLAYNNTLDRLETAFLELEQFNAYASHELRNSLAILRTRLEVDSKEGNFKEALSFAVSYVKRISVTVDDILALSSGQIEDSNELVDLALVAAQAVDEYSLVRDNITLELPDEGVPPVAGKEAWLYRAVSNLIDNAVKHSKTQNPINVAVKEHFGAIVVSVTDFGSGIEEIQQDSIWKPYFKASSVNQNGYGLGLAMVKHVINICGGMIWVDSKPGDGSTFYISLPKAAQ